MKTLTRPFPALTLVALIFSTSTATLTAATSKSTSPVAAKSTPGLEAAKQLSLLTGVAISPLLGTGAVGAYQYFQAPPEKRASLHWYAQPWFWIPALLLVAVTALKDTAGTALPTALKKPLDVAETVENKISGLVATGAFVPLIFSIFPHVADGAQAWESSSALFATVDGGSIINLLLTPLAMIAFVLVWLASHAINVLILLSPFTTVDAALKSFRVFLLSLVTCVSFTNPYAGAMLSAIIIVIAYFLAGWSFRATIFGTVYIWDFLTARRARFRPEANSNWMFTARKMGRTPVRSYGKLTCDNLGNFTFEYRPWLFLSRQTLICPAARYAVGRELFYPQIIAVDPATNSSHAVFVLPPRYRTHEEALARAYGLEIRDVGVLGGFKAIWNWLKSLLGGESSPITRAA